MQKLIRNIGKMQLVIGLLLINLVLVIIYTPSHYYFEMLQSLAFQILFLIGGFLLVFLFTKKWVGAFTTALAILILLFHLPLIGSKVSIPANTSVAHFNVLKLNKAFDKTIRAALDTKADFISFNEITPEWECQLIDNLQAEYPYYHSQLAENNSFGIAVFSKKPLHDVQVRYWGADYIPSLTGYTTFLNQQIHFVAAHTIPPVSKYHYAVRNNHLHQIKDYLQTINGPKMLIGDLNAVSWSAPIVALREENKLLDSRQTWQPTYPAGFEWLAIPIDHIFHSQDMLCTEFHTIKSTGSDHYGILGKYFINELYGKSKDK